MEELHHFLGFKISWDLDRTRRQFVARFGMENCSLAKTPAEPKRLFSLVCIHYPDPFMVKVGHIRVKHWLTLFTDCFTVKGVY